MIELALFDFRKLRQVESMRIRRANMRCGTSAWIASGSTADATLLTRCRQETSIVASIC